MLLASSIGQIVHPIFIAFATLLAWFYALIPNYAVAIALLTLTVMIVAFPITRRGTRSMMKMQLLAPELKRIQAKYKAQPSMTMAEKQESRTRLNEEMMALYKENDVTPTGGCLPMFLQFPIFIILYDTIRGLTHAIKAGVSEPLYINRTRAGSTTTSSTRAERCMRSASTSPTRCEPRDCPGARRSPLIALILVAIALQYIQMKQLSGRNPAAAAANPQMQQMQKIFPIIFAVIYIAIPAGVNIYFIVSSLIRIGQQEFMYRRDPHIRASHEALRERTKDDPKVMEAKLAIQQNCGRQFGERACSRAPQRASRSGGPAYTQWNGELANGKSDQQERQMGQRAARARLRRSSPMPRRHSSRARRGNDQESLVSYGMGGDGRQDVAAGNGGSAR